MKMPEWMRQYDEQMIKVFGKTYIEVIKTDGLVIEYDDGEKITLDAEGKIKSRQPAKKTKKGTRKTL